MGKLVFHENSIKNFAAKVLATLHDIEYILNDMSSAKSETKLVKATKSRMRVCMRVAIAVPADDLAPFLVHGDEQVLVSFIYGESTWRVT